MQAIFYKQLEPISLFKKAAKLTATLAFALLIFVSYLVFTPTGTKTALSLISDYTPYQIEFTHLEGCLAHHLEMTNFHLTGPQMEVRAMKISMGWKLAELIKPTKTLQYIDASKVEIFFKMNQPPQQKNLAHSSLNTLQSNINTLFPIPIKVDNIHLTDAKIHWNNQSHILKEFKVRRASNELASIEEIHYQGAWGKLHATLHDAINVDWNLNISEHPFFLQYFTSAITTQGHIFLPSRSLNDPQNHIQANLKAKTLKYGNHHLKDLSVNVKGNLLSHRAVLKGTYGNAPIQTTLTGKLSPKKWQGKIQQFEVQHRRWQKIGNSTAQATVDWQTHAVITSMHILLGEQYPIHFQAAIKKEKTHDLSGQVQANLSNVKSLSTLVPFLRKVGGKLEVDLKLGGTLMQPQWSGDVLLKDAKIRTIAKGTKPTLDHLHIKLQANKMTISGLGNWGKGNFTVEGFGTLSSDPTLTVNLNGEQLLISDSPEYYIVANPALKLTLQNGKPLLEGKIIIPQAQIQSLKNPDMITPSQDVVIISNKPTTKPLTEQNRFNLATNIELILNDNITYKGHGFTSKIGGKLQIQQQPEQLPTAKGKLIFKEGRYRAYGKTFDIVYGQILFTGGPIYNPILDIRAQRKIQSNDSISTIRNGQPIVVGMKFGGNVRSPKIEFYSTPHMPDADIISYLVVGYPHKDVNQAQAGLLFEAVSQLATVMGKNRSDINFDLAEKLKLDQFGFSKKANALSTPGRNPLEDTVFVLGKQLSERLYLNYSVGVADSSSNVGVRYALGKNVTVEAQAGTQASSADILLSFDGH